MTAVIDATIANYTHGPRTIIRTEIINTAKVDNLVETKSMLIGTRSYFVLQKID